MSAMASYPEALPIADAGKIPGRLDRLLSSDLLRRSASLSHLLQYLVGKAIEGEGAVVRTSIIRGDAAGASIVAARRVKPKN